MNNNENTNEIGKRIKQIRLEKGMTLEEVGKKVGVGKSTVRKWEVGMIANMKRDKIAKLAIALEVSPAVIMGWTEPDNEIVQKASLDAKRQKKIDQLTDQELQLVDNLIDTLIAAHNN